MGRYRVASTPAKVAEQPLLYSVLRDFKECPGYASDCKNSLARITFSAMSSCPHSNSLSADIEFLDEIFDLLCLIEDAGKVEAKNK